MIKKLPPGLASEFTTTVAVANVPAVAVTKMPEMGITAAVAPANGSQTNIQARTSFWKNSIFVRHTITLISSFVKTNVLLPRWPSRSSRYCATTRTKSVARTLRCEFAQFNAHGAPQRCPNTDPRCAENSFKVPKNEGFCFESASKKNDWKVLPAA